MNRVVGSYLHCPLSVSQLTSGGSTPGREQLQTSHPTTGWQPNVSGSHSMHSGCSVLGGQIQSPVTGSHSRVPQLQAGTETRAVHQETRGRPLLAGCRGALKPLPHNQC